MSDSTRRVVVTGGGSGIGRATALRFAARGDRVLICGRRIEALEETARLAASAAAQGAGARSAGGASAVHTIETVACDVSDETSVTALFESAGQVDVLVANAGVAHAAPIAKQSLADWQRLFAVNATGPFLCARAAIPAMKSRGSGRVIVVASTAGLGGYAYTSAYTASKHAAVGLVRALAVELAGSGVTINAVCPSFVASDMTDESIARITEATGRSADEAQAELEASSPLGRLLSPDEVADAVHYLASDQAASVSGHCLTLDGGGLASG